ncbi:helix-hairpin-helix domain-containing protein [Patescibacteria group bacterium]|nr:helix-hairpin-helix domain-containing protein [Patescibacteria group bacterium]
MRWWGKLKWIDGVLVLGLVLIMVGLGLAWRDVSEGERVEVIKDGGSRQTRLQEVKGSIKQDLGDIERESKVVIDIGGEVMKAGVYELTSGSRVIDILVKAGGLSEEADRDWVEINLNKAEMLRDGQKIYIPNKKITNNQFSNEQTTEMVSLNNASSKELEELPGIGPSLAGRIIDYREENGGFRDVNEIKLVSGIGEKMFEKIKDKITL